MIRIRNNAETIIIINAQRIFESDKSFFIPFKFRMIRQIWAAKKNTTPTPMIDFNPITESKTRNVSAIIVNIKMTFKNIGASRI